MRNEYSLNLVINEEPYRLVFLLYMIEDTLGVINCFRVSRIKEILDIAEKADAARPLPQNADAIDKLYRLTRKLIPNFQLDIAA